MARTISLWILAVFFILAGGYHFINPDFYMKIMPPFVPWHAELVALSGILEILGGAMAPTRWRRRAGIFLIALLVAVFPANIYATLKYAPITENTLMVALLWLRLPFQVVLVWWVWWTCLRASPTPEQTTRTATYH